MVAVYAYPERTALTTNARLLREQIIGAGLSTLQEFRRDLSGALEVVFPAPLSVPQQTLLATTVAAHDHTQLTAAQQAAQTETTQTEQERDAARAAWITIRDGPNNTALTYGVIRPILRYLIRRQIID
jgi:hypothetical protein